MGNERMVEIVKEYGTDRIIVNSAADWGVSDPLTVPKTAALMLQRGLTENDVHLTCYQNALTVYGKNGEMTEADWVDGFEVDQNALFEGNRVLRGQAPKAGSSKNIINN
jgi:hypothetical protein